jgi:subtilisin family serine protease
VGILTTVSRGAGEEAMVKTKTRYAAEVVAFAGKTTAAGIAAKLIDCGAGASPDDFSVKVAGNLAFVRRGDVEPAAQVENAMNAGAIGVVLYGDGGAEPTLGTPRTADGRDWIPAVAVSSGTGTTLRKSLNKPVTMASFASDWGPASGTSMAAPFVSGVAALMLQANPALSADALVEILEQTATPLGDEGYDTVYGWGLVNADAAVRAAAAH